MEGQLEGEGHNLKNQEGEQEKETYANKTKGFKNLEDTTVLPREKNC